MGQVNYIKHLNGVFLQFSKDRRLNPTHISLYMALFQIWNNNRFVKEFYLNREEVMSFSKIGSKSTYHRCIKELSHWKYVNYIPSHNPFKGSTVKLFNFETSTEQVLYPSSAKNETTNGQAVVPIYKHIQRIENKIKQEHIKKLDDKNLKKQYKEAGSGLYRDNLRTTVDKNYNEPL